MIHEPFLFDFLRAGLFKANKQAAVHGLAPDIGVAAWWQRHSPGEKALRQLELMNERGAQLLRQDAPARDEEHPFIDHGVHAFRVNAWQSKKNQKLRFSFQYVCRRLPGRAAHLLLKREKMLMEPLSARKPVDGLEPHPAGELALSHGLALPFKITPKNRLCLHDRPAGLQSRRENFVLIYMAGQGDVFQGFA
jgi:hypothetical protein